MSDGLPVVTKVLIEHQLTMICIGIETGFAPLCSHIDNVMSWILPAEVSRILMARHEVVVKQLTVSVFPGSGYYKFEVELEAPVISYFQKLPQLVY